MSIFEFLLFLSGGVAIFISSTLYALQIYALRSPLSALRSHTSVVRSGAKQTARAVCFCALLHLPQHMRGGVAAMEEDIAIDGELRGLNFG